MSFWQGLDIIKNMEKTLDNILKEIESSFDFEKVHKVMTFINWEWYFGKSENGKELFGVPSLQTIKDFAFNLIEQSFNEQKQISSGGFAAWLDENDIILSFTLEEQSTELEKIY